MTRGCGDTDCGKTASVTQTGDSKLVCCITDLCNKVGCKHSHVQLNRALRIPVFKDRLC